MIREEWRRLTRWEERHRRLVARLLILLLGTLALDAFGAVAMYFLERHTHQTEITSFGDAAFFSTTQLLTVSSSLKNPVTGWGRVVDIALETWAVLAIAGSAGAIASFFRSAPGEP